jgi:pyruvate formate lyase activating enzyme
MKITHCGLEKLSLIDYPGKLSAVIFTVGCTFRCPFCYNPMLVLSNDRNGNNSCSIAEQEIEKDHTLLTEDDLFLFLESRRGKLEGVVVSGGEPTMHEDLPEFIERIRRLGFNIKLDTNGTEPEMLRRLLAKELIDYLAMDIKAAPDDYARASGTIFDFDKIKDSVKIIMSSNLPYEFRTTCVPGFVDENSFRAMGEMIQSADRWYLQNFKSDAEMVDRSLIDKPGFTTAQMAKFAEIGGEYVKKCEVRG